MDDFEDREFLESTHCTICDGYYGPNFGQPVCLTCHLYLFHDVLDPPQEYVKKLQDNDEDSGNEELEPDPQDPEARKAELSPEIIQQLANMALVAVPGVNGDEEVRQQYMKLLANGTIALPPGLHVVGHRAGQRRSTRNPDNPNPERPANLDVHGDRRPMDPARERLRERVEELSTPRAPDLTSNIVESLPLEVLDLIFSYLDDFSLCATSKVCQKWKQLVDTRTSSADWQGFVLKRWPFYEPFFRPCPGANTWFDIYCSLVESSCCFTCVYNLHMAKSPEPLRQQPPEEANERPLCHRRIESELKALETDPQEGIRAEPLDKGLNRWIATIQGPVDSPYMGGVFYLSILLSSKYPLKPPKVQFLTKIFHPNVSRHGQIGIDCIGVNWSVALTLSKILVSVQSLLTDPYCTVCMEPKIGRLYCEDRKLFNLFAVKWTQRFAMHDMLNPSI